jgi:hypothetical protein
VAMTNIATSPRIEAVCGDMILSVPRCLVWVAPHAQVALAF